MGTFNGFPLLVGCCQPATRASCHRPERRFGQLFTDRSSHAILSRIVAGSAYRPAAYLCTGCCAAYNTGPSGKRSRGQARQGASRSAGKGTSAGSKYLAAPANNLAASLFPPTACLFLSPLRTLQLESTLLFLSSRFVVIVCHINQ